jgi:hypothetical protein
MEEIELDEEEPQEGEEGLAEGENEEAGDVNIDDIPI